MVVNHDDIEGEGTCLFQHGANSILNGSYPIAHRDNHTGLYLESLLREGDRLKNRSQIGTDTLQMSGASGLHLHLYRTIAGIHIVKLFLARFAQVVLYLRIKELAHMRQGPQARDTQSQIVKCRKAILLRHLLYRLPQEIRTIKQQRAEIEIIPQATLLVVNDRMRRTLSRLQRIIIGIQHTGLRIVGQRDETFQSEQAQR